MLLTTVSSSRFTKSDADLRIYTDVRWLSCGKVLKRLFQLRVEIAQFMTDKGRVVPKE